MLAQARGKAGDIAKQSSTVRSDLLEGLARQKAGKEQLAAAKEKAAAEDKGLATLRVQADAAMKKAVDLAGATGDEVQVAAAKDKAHSLYRKMVDEKIRVASVRRTVVDAQKKLAAVSAEVEKLIEKAKATASAEADALKQVAHQHEAALNHAMQKSKLDESQAVDKNSVATKAVEGLKTKLSQLDAELKHQQTSLKNANRVDTQAKSAEQKVTQTNVDVAPFDFEKVKAEAKKIVTSGGQVPGAKSIHDSYAKEVQEIEKKRLAAKNSLQDAEKKLQELKSSKATHKKLEDAQVAVNAASDQLKKLGKAQHRAVMRAVSAVEKGVP